MRRLDGKIALITGTGSGQGRTAALRFAQEGAKVVGCDLHEDTAEETVRMVEKEGGSMVSRAPINMSAEEDVLEWFDFAVRNVGDFDVLYNNAAGCRMAPIEDLTLEDWNYTLRNELTLVFLAIKHSIPVFRRRGAGCVLNTASISGLRPSFNGTFSHGVAKAGVIALTENMAVELAPLNIRVNAISPGLIETPGTVGSIEALGREVFEKNTLNHRLGQSEDVAAAATYLCSDEAHHVTGINLIVDGGTNVAPPRGRAVDESLNVVHH